MEVLDYLLREYIEKIELLSTALADNRISSYEEYKYVCGQILGLEAACRIIEDLKHRTENSDDE